MSGYSSGISEFSLSTDVLSILRHNLMLHIHSIGLVLNGEDYPHTLALLEKLKLGGHIIDSKIARYTRYDYIIMPLPLLNVRRFLSCLTVLSRGGILVLEVTGKEDKYEDKYAGMVGGTMSATKLKYGDRSYIVIHAGDDYGD